MSNQAWPWPFVEYLITYFGLNECEAADLSDRAQQLLDTGISRDDYNGRALIERLWQRANKLVNEGSPMQPIWDRVKRAARS